MPQSKFARRRPKYTPPKVCKKSPRGGNFPPATTTCPPAEILLATIVWPKSITLRIGSLVTSLWISRKGNIGCLYTKVATTPKNERYELHVAFNPLGTTAQITLTLGPLIGPQDLWELGTTDAAAPSPTPLPWTTVPGSPLQPAKDPALLLLDI